MSIPQQHISNQTLQAEHLPHLLLVLPRVIQIDVKDDEITYILDPVEKTTAKKKRHPAKNKANQV